MNKKQLMDIELDLLLRGIQQRYGYDFNHYARASLIRRVTSFMTKLGFSHISEAIKPVLHEKTVFNTFLKEMSISVTAMFRDPKFYAAVREKVIPYLQTYPIVKIWIAGCATGEEVYSIAIVLKEEGIFNRCRIYATDFNNESLDSAKEGIYTAEKMKTYLSNYNKSAPKGSFSDYFHAGYNNARMSDDLREHIFFANHNLSVDKVFGEMHLIICRNVMIYFDKKLQNRVLELFKDSLCNRGFLCLGTKESLKFSSVSDDFLEIDKKLRIFRKRSFDGDFFNV